MGDRICMGFLCLFLGVDMVFAVRILVFRMAFKPCHMVILGTWLFESGFGVVSMAWTGFSHGFE